jgi:Ni/Fe-hydrogenase subunit HybB-like protein
MVWGAYFLAAHGLLSAAWLAAFWFRSPRLLDLLVLPVLVVAVLATSYTGFLFAQGLGRDLWQGPAAAIDLIAQSVAAGAAALLIAGLAVGGPGIGALAQLLALGLAAHLVILLFEHVLSPSPSRHHELATVTFLRGPYAGLFWGVAIAAGGIVPLLLLTAVDPTKLIVFSAAVLALAGGVAWEYIWVEAGQSVPLS